MDFAHLPGEQIFLMVQAMEAWFFADRVLRRHTTDKASGSMHFRRRASYRSHPKDDLVPSLESASRDTKTKGHTTRLGTVSRCSPGSTLPKVEQGRHTRKQLHRSFCAHLTHHPAKRGQPLDTPCTIKQGQTLPASCPMHLTGPDLESVAVRGNT